jgi:hypothetical protein
VRTARDKDTTGYLHWVTAGIAIYISHSQKREREIATFQGWRIANRFT